jgi:hypothetical protein
MFTIKSLLLAIAASAALAAPSPAGLSTTKSFSVKQVKANTKPLKHPLSAMVNAHMRYSGKIPEHLELAVAGSKAGNDGSAVATPQSNDREYTVPVQIGGQTVYLDFDTGSSDLWVFSEQTPANETSGRPIYNTTASPTWKLEPGYSWKIGYADGSGCGGFVGTDTLNIGGFTMTDAPIEAATQVSSSFAQSTEIGGLLGLAYPKINTVKPVKAVPPFFAMIDSLAEPLFTVDLNHGAPGSYDFGTVDSSKFKGSLNYVDVNTTLGYWTFPSAGYKVGSGPAVAAAYPSVADTGTSLMLMNSTIVDAYYKQVPNSYFSQQNGGYMYPCSSKMPSFSVELGNGYYGVIAPELMTYTSTFLGLSCFGSLQPNTGMPYNLQILGDILYKSQFVVHNGKANTLGFAAKA